MPLKQAYHTLLHLQPLQRINHHYFGAEIRPQIESKPSTYSSTVCNCIGAFGGMSDSCIKAGKQLAQSCGSGGCGSWVGDHPYIYIYIYIHIHIRIQTKIYIYIYIHICLFIDFLFIYVPSSSPPRYPPLCCKSCESFPCDRFQQEPALLLLSRPFCCESSPLDRYHHTTSIYVGST